MPHRRGPDQGRRGAGRRPPRPRWHPARLPQRRRTRPTTRPRRAYLAAVHALAPYFAGGVEWPRVMASGVGWGRCGGGSGVGFVAIRVWGWWVVGCGGRG